MTAILSRYEELVEAGELQPDPEQRSAAEQLDLLQQSLEAPKQSRFLR